MKYFVFLGLCAVIATCELPIGDHGKYGTAIIGVGYRLPQPQGLAK